MNNWGKELILDLSNCNVSKLNKKELKKFFKQICDLLDLEPIKAHFWGMEELTEEEILDTPDNRSGCTAVQFIYTSNITVHSLDRLGKVYINLFSCSDFDENLAAKFIKNWFEGNITNQHVLERD